MSRVSRASRGDVYCVGVLDLEGTEAQETEAVLDLGGMDVSDEITALVARVQP